MGASGWGYFTPYQSNIEAALQDAQQRVFESGAYGPSLQFSEQMLSQIPQLKAAADSMKEVEAEMLNAFGPITSIDDLREAFVEAGTHTIIDIERISLEPEIGTASPAPQAVIQEVYGSPKPTHQDVDSKQGTLIEILDLRWWQATYVIVYKDGEPNEIYFEGCSGD